MILLSVLLTARCDDAGDTMVLADSNTGKLLYFGNYSFTAEKSFFLTGNL